MTTANELPLLGIRVIDPELAAVQLDAIEARFADPGAAGLAVARLAYPNAVLVQPSRPRASRQ